MMKPSFFEEVAPTKNSAWRHTQDRGRWKQLVETSNQGHARDDDDDDDVPTRTRGVAI